MVGVLGCQMLCRQSLWHTSVCVRMLRTGWVCKAELALRHPAVLDTPPPSPGGGKGCCVRHKTHFAEERRASLSHTVVVEVSAPKAGGEGERPRRSSWDGRIVLGRGHVVTMCALFSMTEAQRIARTSHGIGGEMA